MPYIVYGNPKKKWVAILLCCCGFFGFAGLHKFYEGKPRTGLIYLCTLGKFFLGTFLDLLALLTMPSTYYV
ncbi:MAG: TM2 domain-containing protein [Oscillospiraceae bacterium]|nr:TM2 domain-containing protein [Oscillospiraceae bacterium]